MPRFRKKPVEIDAVQLGDNEQSLDEVFNFINDGDGAAYVSDDCELFVLTLEGSLHVSVADWVIRGVAGEYYPCKPDIFEATYEPVD